jgi:TRAP-type mannitol/chloroaromatic compound transport system substrate-binding protein
LSGRGGFADAARGAATISKRSCLKATNELWAEISAKNEDFKKLIGAMQAFRNDEYLWWQVAEYNYDTFMIRSRAHG